MNLYPRADLSGCAFAVSGAPTVGLVSYKEAEEKGSSYCSTRYGSMKEPMKTDTRARIGIIGAGIMAKGMAHNFLKKGHAVSIWNRTVAHVTDLVEAGAQSVASPRAAVEAADLIIECVTDDAVSREMWTNPETGILAGAQKGDGKIYAASSTLSLAWTDELVGLCQGAGIDFLDMPLTGSRAGAEGGTLRLLVGGDARVLERARPALEAISAKIYHFGRSGAGMRFKLVLNALTGIHSDAAAQAATLAQKAGLDLGAVQFALVDGAMGPASQVTIALLNNRDAPDTQVNFATKWLEKDLRYAQAMACEYRADFSVLDTVQAEYAKALEQGLGDQDQTKVIKLYR